MLKETIICIIIIVTIFTLDFVTQGYTEERIDLVTEKMEKLEKYIEENNKEEMTNTINDINTTWDNSKKYFSYYLEHDELEKVDSELKEINSYIQTENNDESMAKIKKTIFILEHIKDKNSFSLKNVF